MLDIVTVVVLTATGGELTWRKEHRLRVFKNRVWWMFGHKRQEAEGEGNYSCNEEIDFIHHLGGQMKVQDMRGDVAYV